MKLNFLVQNPHNIPVSKQIEVDGQMVSAALEGFEVQLLTQDGMSGTLVLRFFGSRATEARDLFTNNPVVTASFGPDSSPTVNT